MTPLALIYLVVILAVVCLVVWALVRYTKDPFRSVGVVIVALLVVLWLLQLLPASLFLRP